MAFVGSRNATEEQLRELVSHPAIALPASYYFIRWFHTVSGVQKTLPNGFLSPEGQLFNATLELRWKQRGSSYEVLLLSETEPDSKFEFSPLEGKWECCDRKAYFYDNDETKFPQGFLYHNAAGQMLKPPPIKQRYFRNSQTSTIHFVALTVDKKS